MAMVIGSLVVLVGVVIGWYTISGSGINRHPGSHEYYQGESPLDSPWTMDQWSRGTGSSARRRKRRS